MSPLSRLAVLLLAALPLSPASAAERADMLGKWNWQKFTIEVRECAGQGVCAKVVAGPKNVGMDIFASELTQKDGDWFGKIVDPETKVTFNTRMRFTKAKSWQVDGCTEAKVCLTGEFVRAK